MNDSFKALSDPTRREILKMLSVKDLTAGDIADAFDMTKPSISHHLSILKNSDLVISEKKGQYVEYSLNTTVFQELTKWFFEFFDRGDENEK